MAFPFCWVVARRQPWLHFHCTAAAGRGIISGVSALAFAAAAETKRYAVPNLGELASICFRVVARDAGNWRRCSVSCSQRGPYVEWALEGT